MLFEAAKFCGDFLHSKRQVIQAMYDTNIYEMIYLANKMSNDFIKDIGLTAK